MPLRVHGVAQASGLTAWFTGLSGAGKSTLATAVCERLKDQGWPVVLLDGDDVRQYLWSDLGFSRRDREENARRLASVACALNSKGIIALVAAISPYRSAREEARLICPNFVEVYVNAPLEVCESRDPKGHYRRARGGELLQFTGLADPYQPPLSPDVECLTDRETIEESTSKVIRAIQSYPVIAELEAAALSLAPG